MNDFHSTKPKLLRESIVRHSQEQMNTLSTRYQKPLNLLIIITISIFTVEMMIMFLFLTLPPLSPVSEALFDSTILVLVVSPVLYFFLFRPLLHHIKERKQAEDEFRKLQDSLGQQVRDRTRHLKIIAALSEHLSAILNVEELSMEVVNQIKENFGYYYAHIYLLDQEQEHLVVAAGTGEAGVEMKERGHSIPLDAPTSLVARAARTTGIVRVDNVREAEDWLPNRLLPDTYSEMAVPIILGGEVVGVLDVQENRIGGLDEGDADLLRSLANQVAVAIRNARQFEQVQIALANAQAIQEQYLEQAWDRDKIVRQNKGQVRFSLGESTTLTEEAVAQARNIALTHPEPTVAAFDDGNDNAYVAPITLRNVPIGNLQLHGFETDANLSDGDRALIAAIIDQVAQAAENLRLLNDSQERASREQLIGQISDKLRRASDLETMMKIGVEEISRVLNPARTFIQFGSRTELGNAPQPETAASVVKEAEATEDTQMPPAVSANGNTDTPLAHPGRNGQGDE